MEHRRWAKTCRPVGVRAVRMDHLRRAHFPPQDYPGCVLGCLGGFTGGRTGEESEWRGKLSWREVPGGLCHISHPPHAAPFCSRFGSVLRGCQPAFHGPAAWVVSPRWVLFLIQSSLAELPQQPHTKPQRVCAHPLLPHAKLGTTFPPAVEDVCLYINVRKLAHVSPRPLVHRGYIPRHYYLKP